MIKLRISAFVLCLMMIFSTCSLASDIEYVSPESAEGIINVLNENVRIDSSSEKVTRAEFVAVLTEACSFYGKVSGSYEFDDVKPDNTYYAHIKCAAELGWISKSQLFYPDNSITLSQALKICVTALGGGELAEMSGGYPFGYFSVAKEAELLSDLSVTDTNGEMSGEDAAILIFRVVTSETFETIVNTNGFTTEKSARTILGTMRDMYVTEGVLTANSLADLSNIRESDALIKIDGKEYVSETIDENLLGYNVIALCKKRSGVDSIVALVKGDNSEITLTTENIDDVQDGNVLYITDGKEKKLKLDTNVVFVKNGKINLLSEGMKKAFEVPASFHTFIDNNNDGKYDIVNTKSYKYTFVDYTNLYDGFIYDKFSSENLIDISDSECNYKVYEYTDGNLKATSVKSVVSGCIVAVARSNDGKYVEMILCSDTVSGKIDEINKDDGKVRINSVEYILSDYYNKNYIYQIGTSGIFYLGLNGDIVGYESSAGSLKYAWIINAGNLGSGLSNDYALKLFTQDEEVVTLSLEDDVNVDGKKQEAENIIAQIKTFSDNERFIKFGISPVGKISVIDTAENRVGDMTAYGEVRPSDNMLTLCLDGDGFQGRPSYIMKDANEVPKFHYAASKYLFVIPEVQNRNDDELYRLAKYTEIPTSDGKALHTLCAYNMDLSGCPEAIVFAGGYLVGNSNSNDANFAVIEKITRGNDPDGMECNYIYAKCNGIYEVFYLTDKKAKECGIPSPGDIISVSFDVKRMIESFTVWFDFSTYTFKSDFGSAFRGGDLMGGFAYSCVDNYMYLMGSDNSNPYMPKCPDNVNFDDVLNIKIANAPVTLIEVERSQDGKEVKNVRVGSAPVSSVVTYRNGDESKVSYVVARLEWSANYDTFVYNITYK